MNTQAIFASIGVAALLSSFAWAKVHSLWSGRL